MRPPTGICLPVEYRRCRDGDTVEVARPGSANIWAVRLLDCWCPALDEPGGPEAKAHAEHLLADAQLHLWVPFEHMEANLLKAVSFDRLLGHLWINSVFTLSEALVAAGHATRTKAK